MSLYAPIVKSHLVPMGIRTENIAVMPAISRTDSEVAAMTKEQIQNEKNVYWNNDNRQKPLKTGDYF